MEWMRVITSVPEHMILYVCKSNAKYCIGYYFLHVLTFDMVMRSWNREKAY